MFEPDDRLVNAVVAALLNGLVANLAAAVLTYGSLSAIGRPVAPLWVLVFIAVAGGVLAALALTVVIVVVFVGYRRGANPDDLVGPAMTTAGDVFGMASLFAATEGALLLL